MSGYIEQITQGTIKAGGVIVGTANGLVAGTGSVVVCEEVNFVQTSGAGTYTASITVPAGGRIIDIGTQALALWTGSSAALTVGDVATPTGFFTSTDLVATDLLVGETNNIEHPGGKAGAYIASEQRVLYSATERVITWSIAQTGTGTAGRTRGYVVYAVPTAVAATKA